MFTGLIADVGTVRRLTPGDQASTLEVKTGLPLSEFQPGDSLAVNGVCLTVTRILGDALELTAVAETLKRTALDELKPAARINLERPMQLGGRLDGHLVQGHVDGVGTLLSRAREGDAWRLTISHPAELAPYLVPKGSVAVDGVSLTVAGLAEGQFEVSVIPHSLDNTTLRDRPVGARFNLEMDIIGKYVAKMLQAYGGKPPAGGLTAAKLAEHGFF